MQSSCAVMADPWALSQRPSEAYDEFMCGEQTANAAGLASFDPFLAEYDSLMVKPADSGKDLDGAATDFFLSPKQNSFASPAHTSLLFYNGPTAVANSPTPGSAVGLGLANPGYMDDQELLGLSAFANMPNPAFAGPNDLVTPAALAQYSKMLNLNNNTVLASSPPKQVPQSPTKVTKSPVRNRRPRQNGSMPNIDSGNLINTDIYLPPSTPSRHRQLSPGLVGLDHVPASPMTSPYYSGAVSNIASVNASPSYSPAKQLVMPLQGPHRLAYETDPAQLENYPSPQLGFSPSLDHFDNTPESASVPQFLDISTTPNLSSIMAQESFTGGDPGMMMLQPPLPISPTKPHRHSAPVIYHATASPVQQFHIQSAHIASGQQPFPVKQAVSPAKEIDSLAWQPVITAPSNRESEAIIKTQQAAALSASHNGTSTRGGGLTSSPRKSCLPPGKVDSYLAGPSADGLFECLFPECHKLFKRRYNVRMHIQTHLSDRPYLCEVCGSRFVRPHDLRRHEKCHETVKPFSCVCGKTFTRHDALQRHRARLICEGGVEVPGKPKKPAGKRGRPRKTALASTPEDLDDDEVEDEDEDEKSPSTEDEAASEASLEVTPGPVLAMPVPMPVYRPADQQFISDITGGGIGDLGSGYKVDSYGSGIVSTVDAGWY